ncbi:aldehyde dehydrogenase family protein [Clostridium sp. MT-14]|jgi:propionaldehyde dehydrogenase|uniref:Aldehyde dehydrogenase EutE n=1 Tax=Clostridium aromativorans TaxID=2836848 RepID=A0ABS8N2T5_9CLOT|nr:aldehyde dehydrogenase family protein [Clostridium aromativorans]MCC9294126.1 aldehyde dehydrogenase EutE [Clostridium aromativorans]CAB1239883.1 putative aldehyde dehydrogenase, ethanolamine utilization protein [Clostridiaceae bacterium BL-3]
MELKGNDLSLIIEKVLKELNEKDTKEKVSDGVFKTMDEAIEAAYEAQKVYQKYTLEQREKLISSMKKALLENAMNIANLCVKESGMGRVDHKYLKLKLVAEKTQGTEILKTEAYTGDKGLTLVERGAFGVIGSITPSTNPAATVACNAICMLAGGNTVVFSPHPGAFKSSIETMKVLNKAIKEAGGPDNLLTAVAKPSLENTNVLLKDKRIRMLVATGGPGIVRMVLSSGKKAIGAGAGNPPVVVDETADIKKAAKDIISGCSFDNNLPCIAEKEALVVEDVYEQLIEYMKENRAVYEINDTQADKLVRKVLNQDSKTGQYSINKTFVGKSAKYLLDSIGERASDETECLIYRTENRHPFVQLELMMPILPIVKTKDFKEALKLAVEDEHGNRHTAIMHSKNIDNLTEMARKIDTTIFVKNAPSYAGIGFGGEGYTTYTIAGPTGEGLTNAVSFTRIRRCSMVDSFRIV